jgi:hypothetical protein
MDFAPDSMQAARKILNIVDDYRDKNLVKQNATIKIKTINEEKI